MTVESCLVQQSCGGCPQLAVSRVAEQETKVEMVRTALRSRGIGSDVAWTDTQSPRFGYRNRMRLQVVGGRADFFNHAKRDGCAVVRDDLWAAITDLRAATAADSTLLAGVRHVEVRVGDTGTSAVGLAVSDPVESARLSNALGASWLVAQPSGGVPPTLAYRVATIDGVDVVVDVPITSFVQVNSVVNRSLVARVLAEAAASGATTFIDAFSGAGNFSVPLVAQGLSGTAIDTAGDAIAQLGRAELAGIECIEGDARRIGDLGLAAADLVVLDPPRSGLGDKASYQAVADLLGPTTSARVLLVACNVDSFAADVAGLAEVGLRVEQIAAFDMFPGTDHVETLAVLGRST